MLLAWGRQRRTGDAGLVDVVWAFGVGVAGVIYAIVLDGEPTRRVLVGALAGVWALRLGGYLAHRLQRFAEDGRYQELRRRWGARAQARLFGFYQLQAFWVALFSTPALWAAQNSTAPLSALDWVGFSFGLAAISGEAIADRQLHRFRVRPGTQGQVCREGLWRYSRHPNYFFDWLHWFAYVALGWTGPAGWLTLGGPLVMLWFLFRVTGIAPTEARLLASRGDAYREYQRTTSVFVPWWPRAAVAGGSGR